MDDVKTLKSENFALEIVELHRFLAYERNERVISKQILRSGTSIGANIAESKYAESHQDFIHKISISLKEANETKFWLKLLYRSGHIDQSRYDLLMAHCTELIRILFSIKNSKKTPISSK